MKVRRRFEPGYRETVALRDGTSVELRLVRPEDKRILAEGFARMSPESRYLRFFTGKEHLTAKELVYLTEIDGEKHLAIGAVAPDGSGAGVARFIRLDEEPEVAELAVTVVDAFQKKGLGRVLCDRLLAAARERGVKRLRAEVLAENRGMLALLEGQVTTRTHAGTSLIVDVTVPDAAPVSSRVVEEIVTLAARRLLSFRRVFDRDDS